jgi:hypothetical protein
MKRILLILFAAIAVIVVLFFVYKGSVHSVVTIEDYIMLSNTSAAGQQDNVIITPGNEMIYTKTYNDVVEGALYSIKGEKVNHYFFGLYMTGKYPFGLKYFKKPEKVFKAELKLINKDGESFPLVGSVFTYNVVIFQDKAIIGGQTYKRIIIKDGQKEQLYKNFETIRQSLMPH